MYNNNIRSRIKVNSGAQKRQEKAQQQIQSPAEKFRKLTEFVAASSPRLTTT